LEPKKKRGKASKKEKDVIESEQTEDKPTESETQAIPIEVQAELLQADAMEDILPKKKSRVSKASTEILEHTPKRELSGSTPATAPARADIAQTTPGTVIRKPDRKPKSTPITSNKTTPKSTGRSPKSVVSIVAPTPMAAAEPAERPRPPKRRPSTEAGDLDEAPAAKRVRRESATSDADKATPILPAGPKPNRRQTIAAKGSLKTPRSSKVIPVPGTAPPKAASRIVRKPKVSLAESVYAQHDDDDNENQASMIQVEPAPAKEAPLTTNSVEANKVIATPKAKKSSLKPPKTAPAKGLLKDGKAIKRARVSSPGPAPRDTKRVRIEDALLPIGTSGPSFWLMKAEPESRIEKGKDVKFSIDDLMSVTEPEPWTGVRNYAARNNMMHMKKGELGFFYHSNTKVPGIVGILEILNEYTVDGKLFNLTQNSSH
jgi:EVE domain